MLTRTDTPDRWLISADWRARCVSSATICFMYSGAPRARRALTLLGDQPAPGGGDRREGVVVGLAARERRHRFIEKPHHEPSDLRLGLAALAEKDDVLAGEDGVFDLGEA